MGVLAGGPRRRSGVEDGRGAAAGEPRQVGFRRHRREELDQGRLDVGRGRSHLVFVGTHTPDQLRDLAAGKPLLLVFQIGDALEATLEIVRVLSGRGRQLRHAAGEQFEQGHAEGIDIDGRRVRHPIQSLWSHVALSTHDGRHRAGLTVVEVTRGNTEVHDLHLTPKREEDVGWLDVSVNDGEPPAILVQGREGPVQSASDLTADLERDSNRKPLLVVEELAEGDALDPFHEQDRTTPDIQQLLQAHDVRMLEPEQDPGLVPRPRQDLGAVEMVRTKGLHGHQPPIFFEIASHRDGTVGSRGHDFNDFEGHLGHESTLQFDSPARLQSGRDDL